MIRIPNGSSVTTAAMIHRRFQLLWTLAFLALMDPSSIKAEQNLSPLGESPKWERLNAYQETLSREQFTQLLTKIYAPQAGYKTTLRIHDDHALIRTGLEGEREWFRLNFATKASKKPPRYWKSAAELGGAPSPKPLAKLHIAIDPGHIGGEWAQMEERWYRIDQGEPVMEGGMTLLVAKLLQPRFEALGAKVSLVRDAHSPVTKDRPSDFVKLAREDLAAMGIKNPTPHYDATAAPASRLQTLQWHTEKYFYRTSEIRARAERVNRRLRPDLTLCLHFNAEAWGDPRQPDFVPNNHLHLLVNGNYSAAELSFDDIRFEMLMRLLQRTYQEEIAIADSVATSMARETRLPAYIYPGTNARRTTLNPYVYTRNLLANRLYESPVIYLEPYVMNHREVYERVQAGHYQGKQDINGQSRISLYEEYARGVMQGVVQYYQKHRNP